jgi:hypothetical protein
MASAEKNPANCECRESGSLELLGPKEQNSHMCKKVTPGNDALETAEEE